jgi:hypothetical protein
MTYAHPHASLFPFIWIFLETKTQHEKRKVMDVEDGEEIKQEKREKG